MKWSSSIVWLLFVVLSPDWLRDILLVVGVVITFEVFFVWDHNESDRKVRRGGAASLLPLRGLNRDLRKHALFSFAVFIFVVCPLLAETLQARFMLFEGAPPQSQRGSFAAYWEWLKYTRDMILNAVDVDGILPSSWQSPIEPSQASPIAPWVQLGLFVCIAYMVIDGIQTSIRIRRTVDEMAEDAIERRYATERKAVGLQLVGQSDRVRETLQKKLNRLADAIEQIDRLQPQGEGEGSSKGGTAPVEPKRTKHLIDKAKHATDALAVLHRELSRIDPSCSVSMTCFDLLSRFAERARALGQRNRKKNYLHERASLVKSLLVCATVSHKQASSSDASDYLKKAARTFEVWLNLDVNLAHPLIVQGLCESLKQHRERVPELSGEPALTVADPLLYNEHASREWKESYPQQWKLVWGDVRTIQRVLGEEPPELLAFAEQFRKACESKDMDQIRTCLGSSPSAGQQGTIRAWEEFGNKFLEPLIKIASDGDGQPDVQVRAIQALGRLHLTPAGGSRVDLKRFEHDEARRIEALASVLKQELSREGAEPNRRACELVVASARSLGICYHYLREDLQGSLAAKFEGQPWQRLDRYVPDRKNLQALKVGQSTDSEADFAPIFQLRDRLRRWAQDGRVGSESVPTLRGMAITTLMYWGDWDFVSTIVRDDSTNELAEPVVLVLAELVQQNPSATHSAGLLETFLELLTSIRNSGRELPLSLSGVCEELQVRIEEALGASSARRPVENEAIHEE